MESRNVKSYLKAAAVVAALRVQLRIAENAKAQAYGKLKGSQLRAANAVTDLSTEYLVRVRINVRRPGSPFVGERFTEPDVTTPEWRLSPERVARACERCWIRACRLAAMNGTSTADEYSKLIEGHPTHCPNAG